jgi:sodium/bile acid cotransporter 7
VIRKFSISRLPIDPYLLLLLGTVGLAWLLPARGAAATLTDDVVSGAVALLFFLYGARLAPEAIWAGITHWRLQGMVLLSTYGLFPLIGVGLQALLRGHVQPDLAVGLLYLCLLPSTVQSSIAFTSIARGNVAAAVCSASLSNMLGVLITPVLVALLSPASRGGFSLHTLGAVGAQILLPFLAGQVARRWLAPWLSRQPILTAIVDRGSILLVVYAAFSGGVAAGVWSKVSPSDLALILGLDLAILGLVVVSTTLASRRLGFSTEDEIAIVFCGSKKSLAGGVPMATILFAGHAVSLIVLPLMLFHQAQLFVCATLARRYARRDDSAVPAPASEPGPRLSPMS